MTQLGISVSQCLPEYPDPEQLHEYPVPPLGSSVHEAPFRQGLSPHVEVWMVQVGPVKPGAQMQRGEGRQKPPFWQ